MANNLLSYLASAASIRAGELESLNSLPVVSLEEIEPDVGEDKYLNMVLNNAEAFFRATSFTPVVRII